MAYNSKTIWYSIFLILLDNWGNLGKSTTKEYKELWRRQNWIKILTQVLLINVHCAPCSTVMRPYDMQFVSYVTWSTRLGSARWLLLGPNVLTIWYTTGEGNSVVCFPIFFPGVILLSIYVENYDNVLHKQKNFYSIPFPTTSILNKKIKLNKVKKLNPMWFILIQYIFNIRLLMLIIKASNRLLDLFSFYSLST